MIHVFVPALPSRTLAPHGGLRDKRDRGAVIDAKESLGSAAYHAMLDDGVEPQRFESCRITLTLRAAHGSRGKCPRCFDRATCDCYRPRAPGNFSGDIATALIDGAFVRHGIIPSATYEVIDDLVLRVEHVLSFADEGVALTLES